MKPAYVCKAKSLILLLQVLHIIWQKCAVILQGKGGGKTNQANEPPFSKV